MDKSQSLLPAPENDGDGKDQSQSGQESSRGANAENPGRSRKRPQRPKPSVASPEECAAGLTRLLGLLAMGMVSPQKANAMRGILSELLGYHHSSVAAGARAGLEDATVLELLTRDPEVLNLLAPLLTEDQVDMVMRRAGEAEDE